MSKSRAPKPPVQIEPPGEAVVSSFRISAATLARFDRWVLEQNARRRGPKLSRTDVIRGLIDWAADHRPNWEQR